MEASSIDGLDSDANGHGTPREAGAQVAFGRRCLMLDTGNQRLPRSRAQCDLGIWVEIVQRLRSHTFLIGGSACLSFPRLRKELI